MPGSTIPTNARAGPICHEHALPPAFTAAHSSALTSERYELPGVLNHSDSGFQQGGRFGCCASSRARPALAQSKANLLARSSLQHLPAWAVPGCLVWVWVRDRSRPSQPSAVCDLDPEQVAGSCKQEERHLLHPATCILRSVLGYSFSANQTIAHSHCSSVSIT